MIVLQSAIDSTSNQPVPYSNLDYELADYNFHATFDRSTGDIYLFHKNDRSLITISESGTVDTVGTIPQTFEALDKMDITHSGESIVFWESGIGRVHRYNIAEGTMRREDTSQAHRTMFRHAPFLSDDNYIYAIGGYGYWEMRNFLIRYEPEFGQWKKIPSKNDDIVTRSWQGLLYKLGSTFFYFVDDQENEEYRKTHAYTFETESGIWNREYKLEDVFRKLSIMDRLSGRTFSQNPTYMIDSQNRHLGFLSKPPETNLNLVSVDESELYQLNLTALGINDVRAAFYSDKINKWVILGHEFPMEQRNRLKAYLFEFDENHPFLTEYKPDTGIPSQAIILTAGGTFVFVLMGIFLYFIRKGKSANKKNTSAESGSSSQPVKIFKKDDGDISVVIHGDRFKTTEDQALKELWTVITELVEAGESSILLSNIDQRIYSNQSHPSYNSRNRKKLLNIINTACGFELISEERSKIDKRYKVLTIQNDKISLIEN